MCIFCWTPCCPNCGIKLINNRCTSCGGYLSPVSLPIEGTNLGRILDSLDLPKPNQPINIFED